MIPRKLKKGMRAFMVMSIFFTFCEPGMSSKNDRVKNCFFLSEKKQSSQVEATHYFCMTNLNENKYNKSVVTFELFKIQKNESHEPTRNLASEEKDSTEIPKMSRIAKRHYTKLEKNIFGSACKQRKQRVSLNPKEKSVQFHFLSSNPTYYFTDSK